MLLLKFVLKYINFVVDIVNLKFFYSIYYEFTPFHRDLRILLEEYITFKIDKIRSEQKIKLFENFIRFQHVLIFKPFFSVKKTSGSTGQPTPILFNFFQKSAIAGHANYLRKKHNFRIREGYALIWGHSTNLKPIKP